MEDLITGLESIEKLGHKVDLIAPQHVKPFVKRSKNDYRDAEAICVAANQSTMRYVPKKTREQQDIQNLHRIRERLVKARTALVNEIRGLLGEYGIVIPKGRRTFSKLFLEIVYKHKEQLTELSEQTFFELWEEYHVVDKRVQKYEQQIKEISKAHPICQRLEKIPGVGPLTSTALLAAIGDASVFDNARQFSAWLGITPREHSTGGKQRLFGISKRGNEYLRRLLIHGARITLRYIDKYNDQKSLWAKNLKERKGTNCASVALANKNARVIWALIRHDDEYKTFQLAA